MKYAGKPKPPPKWYKNQGPSPIEQQFDKALGDLADLIEKEHWFGDPDNHSRYRVDFILKDARLIIELDGHDYHSSKEQLEKDAIRQRYLTRAGYSVIRFTGREIYRSPETCVAEVRQIYKERMQRTPSKYRALYIDYYFLISQTNAALLFYKKLYPHKTLTISPIEIITAKAVDWLHENSFITAHLFIRPEDYEKVAYLDGELAEYSKGEIRFNIISDELYSAELSDHMENCSHLYNDYYLVADDPIYIHSLRSVLSKELTEIQLGTYTTKILTGGKLLRKSNDETSFIEADLAQVRWQNIWYPIAASMGLHLHEM